ncbi:MAG: hypothetical protein LBC79_06965 [Deltaproteobacteria bacterium]|jgi:hypothetical protein|nr:hypothetical protein [Deltaproteobacteria bacterium]
MLRKYHHIISLGLNCEPSYALEDMYGRLDSYPLSWALVPDVPNLLDALNRMDAIFSQGYDIAQGSYDMFRCKHTGIQFHGKTSLRAHDYQDDVVEAAFQELTSRMRYLHKKFRGALCSGRNILCIVKNHSRDGSPRGFAAGEALALKAALDRMAEGGPVDLLCVDRQGCIPPEFEPQCAEPGVCKRLLDGFAPGERAYLYDIPGWARIFAEFDSVHSRFPDAESGERARIIQQHLETRREERLRDIRERTHAV